MPELIWHGTICCPLSSARFRNSFAPANAEFCTARALRPETPSARDLSECVHGSTAAVHSGKCAAGIKSMRDFAVPSVSPLGRRGRIERCGKTPGERAITRFAAQTRSRPPVNVLCLVPQSWSPQARDRQATGTGLFDGDRFDMIATGVLKDHLKLLYQPLNRYTSLLTETEISVDIRKALVDARPASRHGQGSDP